MTLDELKQTTARLDSLGEPAVSIEIMKKAIEMLDELTTQLNKLKLDYQGLPEEINELKTRLQELELIAIKLEAERNAVVEIHKQVLRDVVGERSNNT